MTRQLKCTKKTILKVLCVFRNVVLLHSCILLKTSLPLRGQWKLSYKFIFVNDSFQKACDHWIVLSYVLQYFLSVWTYWLKWSNQNWIVYCTCAIQSYGNEASFGRRATGWKTHKWQELTANWNFQVVCSRHKDFIGRLSRLTRQYIFEEAWSRLFDEQTWTRTETRSAIKSRRLSSQVNVIHSKNVF